MDGYFLWLGDDDTVQKYTLKSKRVKEASFFDSYHNINLSFFRGEEN